MFSQYRSDQRPNRPGSSTNTSWRERHPGCHTGRIRGCWRPGGSVPLANECSDFLSAIEARQKADANRSWIDRRKTVLAGLLGAVEMAREQKPRRDDCGVEGDSQAAGVLRADDLPR